MFEETIFPPIVKYELTSSELSNCTPCIRSSDSKDTEAFSSDQKTSLAISPQQSGISTLTISV